MIDFIIFILNQFNMTNERTKEKAKKIRGKMSSAPSLLASKIR